VKGGEVMKALLVALVPALLVSAVTAIETGSICGIVVDELTGKPLPYANVAVIGTNMGAMALTDGTFCIHGIPAGTYSVKAMMMGYEPKGIHDIVVEPGKKVTIEFKMKERLVGKTQEIVVEAEVEQIDVKSSATSHGIVKSGDDLHVRGGRSGSSWPLPGRRTSRNACRPNSGCTRRGPVCIPVRRYYNTEEYAKIEENDFLPVAGNPLSTFSIDVDAASFANARRFIMADRLPPKDAIRVEEFINYFDYEYEKPSGDVPFSINLEYAVCPWNEEHNLVHIGLKGEQIERKDRRPSNLVFLIDVSGSMEPENKLPLLKKAFLLLADQLDDDDQIAIVTYSCHADVVLNPSFGSEKEKIKEAIRSLRAGGSTAGHAGIQLAYRIAEANFIARGNNRVILATDGDFNVGVSSTPELVEMIENKRKSGIYLTVLGFGIGNYKDDRLEQIADRGNGNHAYIDNLLEAKKVFIDDLTATLYTIAKDVKIQVEFNPAKVASYRLIGYENRMLKKEDFADDSKDAGEIGAGHTVTALYEIVPAETGNTASMEDDPFIPDDLRYIETKIRAEAIITNEVMTVRVRYKDPDGEKSKQISTAVVDGPVALDSSSNNMRFSAAVAMYAMILRESEHSGGSSLKLAKALAKEAIGNDPHMYRAEFIRQIERTDLIIGLASN
jgi:Ca-activated chloride channel family protein